MGGPQKSTTSSSAAGKDKDGQGEISTGNECKKEICMETHTAASAQTPAHRNDDTELDMDCLNPITLSLLSREELSEAVTKIIPTCNHNEMILIAAYVLRGSNKHLGERRKLVELITTNCTKNFPSQDLESEAMAFPDNIHISKEDDGAKGNPDNQQCVESNVSDGSRKVITKLLAQEDAVTMSQKKSKSKGDKKLALNKLNKSGFLPGNDTLINRWDNSFDKLLQFKTKQGHCNVPYSADYKKLGRWVKFQRTSYKAGKLKKERQARLEAIGFEFRNHQLDVSKKNSNDSSQQKQNCTEKIRSGVEATWELRFNQLSAYKVYHSHCNVPRNHERKELALWCKRQRSSYNRGKLSKQRIERLEALGFEWGKTRVSQTDDEKESSLQK